MSDAVVIVLTIDVVVYTHDLAKGVITGVIISALIFGWRISSISELNRIRQDESCLYHQWSVFLRNDKLFRRSF